MKVLKYYKRKPNFHIMGRAFVKIYLIIPLCLNLISCEGNYFLRSSSCPTGFVRKGGTCVQIGKSYENCKDPDLTLLSKNLKITMCNGETANGLLEDPIECSKDMQSNCIANKKFPAGDISSISAADVSFGISIAGYQGSLRKIKRCKNYAELSVYDTSNPPANTSHYGEWVNPASINTGTNVITLPSDIGFYQNQPVKMTTSGTMPAPLISGQTYFLDIVTSTTVRLLNSSGGTIVDITSQGTGSHLLKESGDGVAQSWDTAIDYVPGLNRHPKDNPWASIEFKCDESNFKKVSTTSAPLKPSGTIPTNGTHAFTEIWQDDLTGLMFTNVLYRGSGSNKWLQMIEVCRSLDGQSAGSGWRIPTLKEMNHLVVNGVSNLSDLNWGTASYVSSTKWSQNYIYLLTMHKGTAGFPDFKSNLQTYYLFCVR